MLKRVTLSATIMAFGASCSPAAGEELWELHYGVTEKLPPDFMKPARDYIADDRKAVPAIMNKCGVRFLAFDTGMTDGAESAYFSVNKGNRSAVACVSRIFPQAYVKSPKAAIVQDRIRERQRNDW